MKKSDYTTTELRGVPVYEQRKPDKRIGKVYHFVFHPHKRQVIGFTVRRPDIALMAHRSDLFVALDRFDVVDGKIIVSSEARSTGLAACKRLGVDWDACTMWQGMPLLTEAEQRVGYVGAVRFRTSDGSVMSVAIDRGASADLLLGNAELPASDIRGFKEGVGDALNADAEDDFLRGGIIIAEDALVHAENSQGGLAQVAGRTSAKVSYKASQVVDKAKPAASELAQKTGDAVNQGAFVVGQRLAKTRGMFSGFKREYRRAVSGAQEEEDSLRGGTTKDTQ